MDIVKGQIVTSRAGRDVTKLYAVVRIEGGRVFLADGKKRTLETPKQKNLRHINSTTTVLSQQEMETDQSLQGALKAYAAEHGLKQQGG